MSSFGTVCKDLKRLDFESRLNTRTREKVLTDLQEALEAKDLVGTVVGVLCFDQHTIRCYGRMIRDSAIFGLLNLSTQNRVSYPRWHHIRSWGKGVFVRLKQFQPNVDDDLWVALVGFEIDPNSNAIPYSCS